MKIKLRQYYSYPDTYNIIYAGFKPRIQLKLEKSNGDIIDFINKNKRCNNPIVTAALLKLKECYDNNTYPDYIEYDFNYKGIE